MYIGLINTIIIAYVLFQVYTGTKKGTIYIIAPAISYIGALLLCKPISIMLKPAIKQPVNKIINYFIGISPDILKAVAPAVKQSYNNIMIMGISYIATVLLIRAILYVLHTTERIPGIKEGSHVLAGCLGLFKAIAIIWLISIMLQLLDSMQLCGSTYTVWQSAEIVKFIDKYNVLRGWIQ